MAAFTPLAPVSDSTSTTSSRPRVGGASVRKAKLQDAVHIFELVNSLSHDGTLLRRNYVVFLDVAWRRHNSLGEREPHGEIMQIRRRRHHHRVGHAVIGKRNGGFLSQLARTLPPRATPNGRQRWYRPRRG